MIFESAVDSQASLKKNEASGQVDLFGGMFDSDPVNVNVPDVTEFDKRERLAMEKEMLGLYVSDHPLSGRERQLASFAEMSIAAFKESGQLKEGDVISLAGLVTSAVTKLGRKSGKPYLMLTFEDFESELTLMLAGKSYEDYGSKLTADTVISVRGQVTIRDDERSLRVYDISVIEGDAEGDNRPVTITIQERQATHPNIERLDKICSMHPGYSSVVINMISTDGGRIFELAKKVRYTTAFASEIKGLFGIGALGQLKPQQNDGSDVADGAVAALEVDQGMLFGSDEPVDNIAD